MASPKPRATDEKLTFCSLVADCQLGASLFVDSKGKITYVTSGAAQMLGLRRQQLLGKSSDHLPAALRKLLQSAQSTGRPSPARQLNLKVKDEEHRLMLTVLPGQPGEKRSGAWFMFNRLGAAAKIEQNLRHLDRLARLGTLSAGLAHEIRNALVASKTFFDLLLEKNQDSEMVEIVRREVGRIDELVGRMLKFGTAPRPSVAALHLHQILDHSLSLLQHEIKTRRITLNRSYGAGHDLLKGDDYQLEQAFLNILLNALEAMGPEGSLFINTEAAPANLFGPISAVAQAPAHLRVTIRDTGEGIPPENMERLFGPFFSTKEGGTGLGLSITRRIIQQHGGSISVKSKPNEGAAFTVVLPAVASTM